jgi:hypothetical protein
MATSFDGVLIVNDQEYQFDPTRGGTVATTQDVEDAVADAGSTITSLDDLPDGTTYKKMTAAMYTFLQNLMNVSNTEV